MARPVPGGSAGTWAAELNTNLDVAIDATTGMLKPSALGGALLVPVATRTAPNYNTNQSFSDGIVTGGTARMSHIALVSCHGIVLAFGNFYNSAGSESDGPQDITIAAAVEPANSKVFPVSFNGLRSVTIKPGCVAFCDPVGVQLTKGQAFTTRTFITVAAAATKFPTGSYQTQSALGEGHNYSNTGGLDKTPIFSTSVTAVNSAYVYAPSGILGYPTAPSARVPNILIVGDSIAAGVGDAGAFTGWGFVLRALNNNYPYSMLAYPSELVASWILSNQKAWRRMALAEKTRPTAVICNLGVNSVKAGSASVQTDLLTVWQFLASLGVPVYQTTITPVTTSTDAWVTTANQTVTANEALRTSLNDYIRTVPAPLTGIFEVADTVETARNSGIWKAAYTDDGTHPNATGHAAATAAVTASTFGTATS